MASSPRPGDFGLWRTPWQGWAPRALFGWLLGWLIRYGTRSKFNHAVLYMGEGQIGEAAAHGFTVHDEHNLDAYAWSTGEIGLTQAERTAITTEAWHMADDRVRYGYLDLLALALSTRGIHSTWVFKRLNRLDTRICSQAVARCYDVAGVQLVTNKLPCEVTPGDLDDVRCGRAVPRYW